MLRQRDDVGLIVTITNIGRPEAGQLGAPDRYPC